MNTVCSIFHLAIALLFSGFKTGTISAYLLSPLIMDTFGGNWRALFYTYGLFGMCVMILWLSFAKDAPTLDMMENETQNPGQKTTTTATVDSKQSNDITSLLLARRQNSGHQQVTDGFTSDDNVRKDESSTWNQSMQVLANAPWKQMIQSKGVWAMVLAHCSKNWALYITLSWTPTFYFEQYNIGIKESAILSILPSVAGIAGSLIAGLSVDSVFKYIQRSTELETTKQFGDDNQSQDEKIHAPIIDDESKTLVRKVFQSIALFGGAISLGLLASNIPDDPVVAQTYLTIAVALQAFCGAGFEGGNQDKAGEKWAGLLYSFTSLPAVMCK
jgi:MFS transporter, ACS family, solute carrier family 17 (sodium-dependent inorganic phosphate cotransporter), other